MRAAIKNKGQKKLASDAHHHFRVCWSTLHPIYGSIIHLQNYKCVTDMNMAHSANESQGARKTLCRSMRLSCKNSFQLLSLLPHKCWDYSRWMSWNWGFETEMPSCKLHFWINYASIRKAINNMQNYQMCNFLLHLNIWHLECLREGLGLICEFHGCIWQDDRKNVGDNYDDLASRRLVRTKSTPKFACVSS